MSMPMQSLGRSERLRSLVFTRYFVSLGFIVAIISGLVGNVVDMMHGKLQWGGISRNESGFWNGEITRGFASRLSKATLPAESARIQRGLNWVVLGDMGPRVRMGCPGWWFLKDELLIHKNGSTNVKKRLEVVVRVANILAARNIKLLVVTVPDKSRVEQDNLCGLARAPMLQGRLDEWVSSLRKNSISNVDLQLVMGKSLRNIDSTSTFLRTDTHWNEYGANMAASAVAEVVSQMAIPILPHQTYKMKSKEVKARWGDLTVLAGLDRWPFMRGLQPDIIKPSQFVLTSDSEKNNDFDDLFGDAELPSIILIGTSYSNASNFVGHLQYKLLTRIGNFARDGGDFSGSAREYFSSKAFVETPPKIIVWELPERVLQMPFTEEDELLL